MKKIRFVRKLLKISMILLAAGMTGGILGCASQKSLTDISLIAGDWQLCEFVLNGQEQEIAAATLTLSSQNEDAVYTASGFSGVNSYHGSFTLSGDAIKPSEGFATTRMMGHPVAMEFEENYLHALSVITVWQLDSRSGSTELVLSDSADTVRLVFSRIRLAGSLWELVSCNTGNAMVSLPADLEKIPSLNFGYDGDVSGNTGVNVLHMTYTADDVSHDLSFAMGAVTLAAAGTEVAAEMEQQYLNLLSRVSTYQVHGSTLTLSDSEGDTLLVFQAKDYIL